MKACGNANAHPPGGPSGSGRSTITKILQRLCPPKSGSVLEFRCTLGDAYVTQMAYWHELVLNIGVTGPCPNSAEKLELRGARYGATVSTAFMLG
jgi:energy-coupling factor transporter ATP-binding protein EcfA2